MPNLCWIQLKRVLSLSDHVHHVHKLHNTTPMITTHPTHSPQPPNQIKLKFRIKNQIQNQIQNQSQNKNQNQNQTKSRYPCWKLKSPRKKCARPSTRELNGLTLVEQTLQLLESCLSSSLHGQAHRHLFLRQQDLQERN